MDLNGLTSTRSLVVRDGAEAVAASEKILHMDGGGSEGPLSGVVLCVTGVPKADRVYIKKATELLGGKYVSDLEPSCTHLVVQRCQGPKFQHAVRFGQQRVLQAVTPRWLVDTILVRVRQDESMHSPFSDAENETDPDERQLYRSSCESSSTPYRKTTGPLSPLCNNMAVLKRDGSRVGEWLVKSGVSKTLSWKTVFNLLLTEGPWQCNDDKDSTAINTWGTSFADPSRCACSRGVDVGGGGMTDCVSISGKEGRGEDTLAIVSIDTVREGRLLEGLCFYLAPDLDAENRQELVAAIQIAGGDIADHWYVGSSVTHAVCEVSSFWGCTAWGISVVTPMWVRRSIEAGEFQRCVHFSADLGRHFACFAQTALPCDALEQPVGEHQLHTAPPGSSSASDGNGLVVGSPPRRGVDKDARSADVRAAKIAVRRRRGPRKEPFRVRQQPPTPLMLLDNICWAVTQPPSAALLFNDTAKTSPNGARPPPVFEVPDTPQAEDARRRETSLEVWGPCAGCQSTPGGTRIEECAQARPLTDRERAEIVYRGAFITLLLPIDRFGEMGPTAKRLFVDGGVSCESLLDCVYTFYQGHMSGQEIQLAIQTDSQQADRLRAQYMSPPEPLDGTAIKRHEFLGSRRNFDGLRRLSREGSGQVYEVLLSS